MQTEKTIRNPSEEEIKKLKEDKATKAQPVHTKKIVVGETAAPVKSKIESEDLKPVSSAFEPKPVKFKLPSGKLICPSSYIWVRRMTTVEEGYFHALFSKIIKLKETDNGEFLRTLDKILENCVKSNIDVRGLSLIDQIPLFIFILGLTYGKKHKLNFKCETCGETFEHEIDLDQIKYDYVPNDFEYPRKIILSSSFDFEVILYLTYPLIGDDFLWNIEDADDNSAINRFLTMIQKAEGTKPDGSSIEESDYIEIAKNLHPDDKEQIRNFVEDFRKYGSDLQIDLKICRKNKCADFGKTKTVQVTLKDLFNNLF